MYRIQSFLREAGIYDSFNGDRIVIGSRDSKGSSKKDKKSFNSQLSLETYVTDIKSAEMNKYASNAF